MSAPAPHPDCAVCTYWLARIDGERVRALSGNREAYENERRMRRELAEHLERDVHAESSGASYQFHGAADYLPSPHPERRRFRSTKSQAVEAA
jgi:hypothetical protein